MMTNHVHIKAGSTHLCVPVCDHDTASLYPTSVERDVADVLQQTNSSVLFLCVVVNVLRLVNRCVNVVALGVVLLIKATMSLAATFAWTVVHTMLFT